MSSLVYFCIAAGILLLASVITIKFSSNFGVPGLLLFLLIGILAGSEGIGGIYFDDYAVAKTVGDVALIFILFYGGLDTQWQSIRPVLRQGLILSTVGVAFTTLILGSFAWFILGSFSDLAVGFDGISWVEGLLLGAIVSSTDAAAVFSILRASRLDLKGNLQPLLELESGSNDPMAVLLTVTLVEMLVTSGVSVVETVIKLFWQLGVGTLLGYGAGRLMSWSTNRLNLDTKGLYPVLTVARVLLTYGIASVLQGNGFLAVYVAGVIFGNSQFPNKETIADFHEGLSWLMQITMFLVLGLLVFPSYLPGVAPVAVGISLFLMFVARPLSVFVSLALTKYNLREKVFISWVGLRGAVPIILAIVPISANLEGAKAIFDVVFFTVMFTVAIQGFTLARSARWLKLAK